MPKYVFITGGVVSSVGKGVAAASLGLLLEARGLKVAIMKLDPYINVDPGTMNPFEHAVSSPRGAETTSTSAITIHARQDQPEEQHHDGGVSPSSKKRRGGTWGRPSRSFPHHRRIKRRIRMLTADAEDDAVTIDRSGGPSATSVCPSSKPSGIQSRFIRALPQRPHNTPFIEAAKRVKTKPTQHSVSSLRQIGIQPNVIIAYRRTNSAGTSAAVRC